MDIRHSYRIDTMFLQSHKSIAIRRCQNINLKMIEQYAEICRSNAAATYNGTHNKSRSWRNMDFRHNHIIGTMFLQLHKSIAIKRYQNIILELVVQYEATLRPHTTPRATSHILLLCHGKRRLAAIAHAQSYKIMTYIFISW